MRLLAHGSPTQMPITHGVWDAHPPFMTLHDRIAGSAEEYSTVSGRDARMNAARRWWNSPSLFPCSFFWSAEQSTSG